MNKYISAIVLSTLGLSAAAEGILSKGKWEAGLVGGWGTSPTKETLTINSVVPGVTTELARYKFTLKGSGLMGGFILGYNLQRAKNIFGLSAGFYKDFYSTRNQGRLTDPASLYDTAKRDLRRKHTLEVAGKFGRMVSEDVQIYAKLGVLHSAFREQYGAQNRTDNYDVSHQLKAWGGVAGIGAQKAYDSLKVGLAYDYQYYQRIGSTMRTTVNGIYFTNKSKIRPQYHNVFLTISKSF